jgi:hypothetical protein
MSQPPRTQGAKYVKIRQGPYQVAANTTRPGEFIIVLEKPCKSCFITAIQGGLEFEDGTPAHVNHGAVLQHLTIYNGNVRDLVCQSWKIALPNRVYATGNEREVARVNPGGSKFGLNMTPDDWYSSRFEIMNEGSKNMTVYVTQVRMLEPEKGNSILTVDVDIRDPRKDCTRSRGVPKCHHSMDRCCGLWRQSFHSR